MVMALRHLSEHPVGVIGAGSFGVVIANLLARKVPVHLYSRSKEKVARMLSEQACMGVSLHRRIMPTTDLNALVSACEVIFPLVPSRGVPKLMDEIGALLKPSHIVIHGIKGLCLHDMDLATNKEKQVAKEDIQTISQIIASKSSVIRIGCFSGPNISAEIAQGLPAAAIIASKYREVIKEGQRLLKSDTFFTFASHDLKGIELCGTLKNIIAVAAGVMESLSLGNNAKALLISRGLIDIAQIGQLLGGDLTAFVGLAGVGDIITSCYSPQGRNFRAGKLLAQGLSVEDIEKEINSTIEGIHTIRLVAKLAQRYRVRCLVAEVLNRILDQDLSIARAQKLLMKLPSRYDDSLSNTDLREQMR